MTTGYVAVRARLSSLECRCLRWQMRSWGTRSSCRSTRRYPDKDCEVYWEPQIRNEEDGTPVYGLTDFADDGSVAVFVKPSLEVADAVEILAHELAHVAVGVEHSHDETWHEAFDKIFEEYNRIGSQMFPDGEQCAMDDPDEK